MNHKATARTPYRASPPASPHALRPHSPSRKRAPSPDYPESPTRSMRRVPSPSPSRPILGSPTKGNYRKPRFWRMTRRLFLFLSLCLLIIYLSKPHDHPHPDGTTRKTTRLARLKARWVGDEEEEGLCRFVSPVEAYHRDLDRLRRIYPHRIRPAMYNEIDVTRNIHNTSVHEHFFSPTGHLIISDSETAPHPIPLLLALGEKRWESLLARQSRTLEQAVEEYQRRYGRLPPKGFDLWWDFAQTHDLVLPDEYDRINLDLAPFFALPKDEMKRRIEWVEQMPETFTLVVRDGHVDIQILDAGGMKWDGTAPRAKDAASLLQVFSRFLPDMKATFSIFDQPQVYLSWARRESLVEMGLHGEHTSHLHETDSAHVRLARSCPPESHFRTNESFVEGRSFIYDSLDAGDICQNPYVVSLHGLTLEPHGHDSHPKPHTQLIPLFSLAKTSINSDILITPLDQFHDAPGKDPKWEKKTSSKLAWRGSATGISMMTKDLNWRQAHRIRLHHFANTDSEQAKTFITPDLGQEDLEESDAWGDAQSEVLASRIEEGTEGDLADFYFDMKLAGGPLQCSDGDGTCSDMWKEISFGPHQPTEELNQNKFLLDIDGNGWSGRFRRLMSTNSMVIKTSLFTEWFQPHLIPWFMYVPAKLDFSDLTDILAFFRGTPRHPDLAFDETAKALAKNGQCFAKRMFRIEDLQAYMMRLFLEYARLAADEGVDMDFHLGEEEALLDADYAEEEEEELNEVEMLEDEDNAQSVIESDEGQLESVVEDGYVDYQQTPWEVETIPQDERLEGYEADNEDNDGLDGDHVTPDHWEEGVLKRSLAE